MCKMRIDVLIKTGKKEVKVIKKDFSDYEVWVKSRPVKGAANKELIKLLSNYFGLSAGDLWIVRGVTSRRKVLEIKE